MMKKLLLATALSAAVGAFPVLAHHPAADMVDPDVYEMIDSLVADTPHADLTFDDMDGGMTETTVTAPSVRSMENMIDDGLLDYAATLDGDVEVGISFEPGGDVVMTITQRN